MLHFETFIDERFCEIEYVVQYRRSRKLPWRTERFSYEKECRDFVHLLRSRDYFYRAFVRSVLLKAIDL